MLRRLLIASIAAALVVLGLGVLVLLETQQAARLSAKVLRQHTEELLAVQRLDDASRRLWRVERLGLTSTEQATEAEQAEALREYEAALAHLRSLMTGLAERQQVDEYALAQREGNYALGQMVGVLRAGNERDLVRLYLERVQPARDAASDALGDLLEVTREQLDQSSRTSVQAQWRARTVSIGAGVFSVLLTLTLLGALLRAVAASERREQEAERARALAESERALADQVIEQSADGIIVVDRTGRRRRENAEARRQLGGGTSGSRAQLDERLLDRDGRPLSPEADPLRRALAGETVRGVLFQLPHDGRVADVNVTAAPLRTAGGHIEGAVVLCRDETERRRIERERDETLARLNQLVSAAPFAIAFLDPNLRVVRANRPLAQLDNHPVEDHVGRHLNEVVWPENRELVSAQLSVALRENRPVTFELEVRPERRRPSGAHHLLAVVYPVRRDGALLGIGLFFIDISARKTMEDALREASLLRERFLGIVGHDLRSPLAAISMNAQLLLRADDVPERRREQARKVLRSAERMQRLIEVLLDFARTRLGGGIPITPRPADLGRIVGEAIDELRLAYAPRAIELDVKGDTHGQWDADRMVQVLTNLLSNAMHHGAEDRPLRVEVDGTARDQVRLCVENEGEPVPAEIVPTIFDPFVRASNDPSGGLGLGLYIVRQIIEGHGGRIQLHSDAHRTVFEAVLPRQPPSQLPAG